MKTISLVAAAVMLASSASAAGNDPRECEGKFLSCRKNANELINRPFMRTIQLLLISNPISILYLYTTLNAT